MTFPRSQHLDTSLHILQTCCLHKYVLEPEGACVTVTKLISLTHRMFDGMRRQVSCQTWTVWDTLLVQRYPVFSLVQGGDVAWV